MPNIYMVFSVLALGLSLQTTARAQQYVYPKEGQSPQQQQQDEYACHQWAVKQTGYDPLQAAQQPQPAPPPPSGGAAKGMLRGAAGGAIIGGIAGDAGKGAAAGAVMGGIGGAVKQNSAQQQQAAAQASSANNAAAGYARARATCLQARGYTVF